MTKKLHIKNYATLIFDCHGVIMESNKVIADALCKLALPFGSDAKDKLLKFHKGNSGISIHEKLNYFLSNIVTTEDYQTSPSVEELLKIYNNNTREGLLNCNLAPGIEKLRKETPSARWLAISNGDERELREVFRLRGIDKWFDGGIFGSPSVKKDIISRELSLKNIKNPALFLGDSKDDHAVSMDKDLDFVFITCWTDVEEWEKWVFKNSISATSSLEFITDRLKHKALCSEKKLINYIEFNNDKVTNIYQHTDIPEFSVNTAYDVKVFSRNLFTKSSVGKDYNDKDNSMLKRIVSVFDQKNSEKIYENEGRVFVLVDRTYEPHYFHWMIQVIPAFIFLQSVLNLEKICFVFHDVNAWQRSTLNHFTRKGTKLIHLDTKKSYHFPRVIIPSLSFRHATDQRKEGWFCINPFIFSFFKHFARSHNVLKSYQDHAKELLKKIRIEEFFYLNPNIFKPIKNLDPALINKREIKSKKIYLTRKGLSRRGIENENALEEIMIEYGFSIIAPDHYSFEEQISLFNNADYIVGPTGAGFTNLIFCKPSVKVAVIQPTSLKNYCGGYATFSSLLGFDTYVYNEAKRFPSHTEGYSVNESRFKIFISNFLSNNFSIDDTLEFNQEWKPDILPGDRNPSAF